MLFVVGVSRAMGVLNHVRKFQNKVCFIGAMYQGRKKLLHVIDCQHIMHVLASASKEGQGVQGRKHDQDREGDDSLWEASSS